MKISKQALRGARELFRSCQVGGRMDESRVRTVVAMLAAKKPRGYVEILARLHRLVKLDLEQHSARVESAVPLPADLQNEVAGKLKQIYGESLDLSFGDNPALLGGLKIRVGCDLYDGSVKKRLEQLEQSF